MVARSWICIYLFVCILEKRFLFIHFGDGSIKYHSGSSIVSMVHINAILQRVCRSMRFTKIDCFHYHWFLHMSIEAAFKPLSSPHLNSSIVQQKAVFDAYPTKTVDYLWCHKRSNLVLGGFLHKILDVSKSTPNAEFLYWKLYQIMNWPQNMIQTMDISAPLMSVCKVNFESTCASLLILKKQSKTAFINTN